MTTIFFGDGDDDWEPSENGQELNEDDEWHGGGGNDKLVGDLYGHFLAPGGVDQLYGDAGNDLLAGQGGADKLSGGTGKDKLYGAQFFYSVDAANELGDQLFGDRGDDIYVLDDVTVSGALGVARYDKVYEDALSGIDAVLVNADAMQGLSFAPGYTLTAEVDNGTISGTTDFRLTGNGLANLLAGNEAANVLAGLAGDDFLAGGFGLDTLNGGDSDDHYVLVDVHQPDPFTEANYDAVIEQAGGGFDSIDVLSGLGKFGYTLGARVENATVIGLDTFALTGN